MVLFKYSRRAVKLLYTGHAFLLGQCAYAAQDIDSVLASCWVEALSLS